MKSSVASLLLPAWKSPPGPDLRLKRDQTFGLALVNIDLSASWNKERLQIQHAEHLHAVFGNSVFLLKHADLAKAEAFHQHFDNLVMGRRLVG
jgi:hypothetical protein